MLVYKAKGRNDKLIFYNAFRESGSRFILRVTWKICIVLLKQRNTIHCAHHPAPPPYYVYFSK